METTAIWGLLVPPRWRWWEKVFDRYLPLYVFCGRHPPLARQRRAHVRRAVMARERDRAHCRADPPGTPARAHQSCAPTVPGMSGRKAEAISALTSMGILNRRNPQPTVLADTQGRKGRLKKMGGSNQINGTTYFPIRQSNRSGKKL